MDETDCGPQGNLLHLPLPKGSGREVFLRALRQRALPFLLCEKPPALLLICAGFDALLTDPLATMTLDPDDFGQSVRIIRHEFAFPAERIALGLEGGYALSAEAGMPAALVQTCAALVEEHTGGAEGMTYS